MIALGGQGISQTEIRIGIVCIEGDGLLVGLARALGMYRLGWNNALPQLTYVQTYVGSERRRLLIFGQGSGEIALGFQGAPPVVRGLDMGVIQIEGLLIFGNGPGMITLLRTNDIPPRESAPAHRRERAH